MELNLTKKLTSAHCLPGYHPPSHGDTHKLKMTQAMTLPSRYMFCALSRGNTFYVGNPTEKRCLLSNLPLDLNIQQCSNWPTDTELWFCSTILHLTVHVIIVLVQVVILWFPMCLQETAWQTDQWKLSHDKQPLKNFTFL